MPWSLPENLEPEHAIEQSNLALCVISEQGELRYRDPPIVVNQGKGGCMVLVSFVALPDQEFRLFVRNHGPYAASADISLGGESLGKWLVAREPKTWHNIACDSVFKFQESYDHQTKVFEPTTIEIRFLHLSNIEEGSDQGCLVPVVVRQPSPEDHVPGYVQPSDDVMNSKFEAKEDGESLTFIISFIPPAPSIILPPLPTTPIANTEPGSASAPSSESGSASSSDSISQMSDDELQEALVEYKNSRLLLPGRLVPGFCGKLSVEDFCRRYELSEEVPSMLAQMKIKDVHGLSRLYLRDLQDKGLALRCINMLRLAVIRFSSESRP